MSTVPLEYKATVQELADVYHVSPKVFRKWLEPLADEIGERVGHYFTPRQIEIMRKHFGLPPSTGKPAKTISPPARDSDDDEQRAAEKKSQR